LPILKSVKYFELILSFLVKMIISSIDPDGEYLLKRRRQCRHCLHSSPDHISYKSSTSRIL